MTLEIDMQTALWCFGVFMFALVGIFIWLIHGPLNPK